MVTCPVRLFSRKDARRESHEAETVWHVTRRGAILASARTVGCPGAEFDIYAKIQRYQRSILGYRIHANDDILDKPSLVNAGVSQERVPMLGIALFRVKMQVIRSIE